MASKAEDLVDAVVSHLAGLTLSQEFTPSKKLVPVFERNGLNGLEVSAYAGPQTRELLTRGGASQKLYTVGLVIRYASDQGPADMEAKASQLLQLSEEIMEALAAPRMAGLPLAEVEQEAPFDIPKAIDEGLLFTEILFKYKGL